MFDVVLFADSSIDVSSEIMHIIRSPGVYRIASDMRKFGLKVKTIDFLFSFSEKEIEEIILKFVSKETKIIGFSTTFFNTTRYFNNDENIAKCKLIVKTIKKHYSQCKIIAGGANVIHFSADLNIDKIFTGYAEEELRKYIYDCGIINQYDSYDFQHSSTIIHHDDTWLEYEYGSIESARGCIFKCKFCSYPLNGKKKFDFIKSEESIIEELETNFNNYKMDSYFLSDETLNDSVYKLEKIRSAISKLSFKPKFSGYLRADLLKRYPEQIQLLKDIGLIGGFFGIETLNLQSSKLIGKRNDKDKIINFLNSLKNYENFGKDFCISVGVIVGLPYETEKSFSDMLDWVRDPSNLVDKYHVAPLQISNPILTKDFKSEFENNSEKYGFVWENNSNDEWTFNGEGVYKTRKKAKEYANILQDAVVENYRNSRSNWGILIASSYSVASGLYSIDERDKILSLDRKEYANWFKSNASNISKLSFEKYKSLILS